MAIQFNTLNSGLARTTGSFLSPSGDFTFMYWVQFPTPIGNKTDYRTASVLGDGTLINSYIWIGSYNGQDTVALSDNLGLDAQNNLSVNAGTDDLQQIPTIWAHLAVTYDSTTHIFQYFMNGSLFESTTAVNMNAITFSAERLGFDLATAISGVGIAYYRSFASKLTATQIKAEMASATAVAASPFCDTPLTSPTDLADISGNNRNWTLIGSGTLLTGPVFLTTITNIDANNAQDIGILPVAIVQNVRDSITETVWFKYTASITDVVIGFYGFGDHSTYVAETIVYDSLANAILDNPYLFIDSFQPIQVPVFSGNTYYFKIFPRGGSGVTPAYLILTALKAPNTIAPLGSLAISDDIDGEFGRPLAILDHLTGQVIQFKNLFPVSNNTEGLPDGILLLSGSIDSTDSNEYLFMLDINLNITHSKIPVPPLVNDGNSYLITSDRSSIFYVAKVVTATTAIVGTVNAATGIAGPTTWTITISSSKISGIAVSLDNTILYYTVGTSGDSNIRRWDLINNIALSDLVAAPSGYHTSPIIAGGACDILVLQNNNIVVPFIKNNHDALIKIYNPSGTELVSIASNQLLDRLTHAIDDPNSFWAWIQQVFEIIPGTFTQSGFSEYRNIKTSDGSTISTTGTLIPNYEFSKYSPQIGSNAVPVAPYARFGASQSCSIFIIRTIIISGGIYKLVTNKRQDTLYTIGDVKIPDPFFKTGLIGG